MKVRSSIHVLLLWMEVIMKDYIEMSHISEMLTIYQQHCDIRSHHKTTNQRRYQISSTGCARSVAIPILAKVLMVFVKTLAQYSSNVSATKKHKRKKKKKNYKIIFYQQWLIKSRPPISEKWLPGRHGHDLDNNIIINHVLQPIHQSYHDEKSC